MITIDLTDREAHLLLKTMNLVYQINDLDNKQLDDIIVKFCDALRVDGKKEIVDQVFSSNQPF